VTDRFVIAHSFTQQELLDLDEDFKASHMPILERFFLLFSNIHKYVKDVQDFFKNVEEGVVFINHTIEKCISNQDGIQLFSEAVYLYGVMLLLMDIHIPGDVRERMLMSYYRYKGAGDIENIDSICTLCRDTSFRIDSKKNPKQYPVKYFKRFRFKESIVKDIINRLNNSDIYRQSQFYPSMEHRSTALSTQASMLYVLLFFYPKALTQDQATMRQIVDKHFPDNWIICFYMGFSVDLSVRWNDFPAAKAAINNNLTMQMVKDKTEMHLRNMKASLKKLDMYLTEGQLTEEYVLDHIPPIFVCLRTCNVTLRWLILHRTCESKKLNEITNAVSQEDILLLLLNTAQFEYILKNMFQDLLNHKEEKWKYAKETAQDRVKELADYFSGNRALQKEKDEQLQGWFQSISQKIADLDYGDSILAGRKIQALITALIEVEEFHQIDQSLQVKQFLSDTREFLKKMIRLVNVKGDVLVAISTISDISYAWEIINDYIDAMQSHIREDPSLIIKMRSTFLKLDSMLGLPLVRIIEAKSSDVVAVSKYYSSELVAFVRRTLEIIPRSLFLKMQEIIHIKTHELVTLPDKFPKKQLKEYAQEDVRFKLSRATYEVSTYTEGILAMKQTIMGVVKVDPKQLLEDGIRKELVRQIASFLENLIEFKTGKIEEFENNLNQLQTRLSGMLQSFQYIQDFVGIYGLKIWQEEFQRVINYNVEQESNLYLRRKVYDHQSLYQSKVIPIPQHKSQDPTALTFMGRLLKELLRHTNAQKTVYVDRLGGWYDFGTGKEVIGMRTFALLHRSIGVAGLNGMDTLISFNIVKSLQRFVQYYHKAIDKKGGLVTTLDALKEELLPLGGLPTKRSVEMLYAPITSKLTKMWAFFMEIVIQVGHFQLLRKHIAAELAFCAKIDAEIVWNALNAMNAAILTELRAFLRDPENHPYPSGRNPILSELDQYMETIGLAQPLEKIYVTSGPLKHIGLIMWLFVKSNLQRFNYDSTAQVLVNTNKKEIVDGVPFVLGVITILRQMHSSEQQEFFQLMAQYIRSACKEMQDLKKVSSFPTEIKYVIRFVQIYRNVASVPEAFQKVIPQEMWTHFVE